MLFNFFNILAYKDRYGKHYNYFLKKYTRNKFLTIEELKEIQKNKFREFVDFAVNNAPFYKKYYQHISFPSNIENISELPLLTKEKLRENSDQIFKHLC